MAYYYDPVYDHDYDWGLSVPDFPDLTNQTKSKCCPERQILDQSEGVWNCVQHDSENEDVINIFRDLNSTDFDFEVQIESLDNLNSVCDVDHVISIWSPDYVDFSDDLARSAHQEDFFKCLDVTRDILTDKLQPVVASCLAEDQICQTGQTERILFLVFGLLSVLAIGIALIVYILLPKQLLNIHGKVVVGNFLSCLMFLVFLMITYSSCWTFWPLPNTNSCQFLGYFGYYSTMAMFSWMFALCLDLFCTFFKSGRFATSSRLLLYCLLGWGLPVFLLLLLLLFDHIVKVELINPPSVGVQSCFLHEDSMNIFLNVPIFIFMSVNTILYVSIVFYIFRTRSSIKKSTKRNKLKENLSIFTKLFLVMGILWAFEIVSLYVNIRSFSLFFGILNISRGSFMFIIFILKTSVLHGLKKLYHSKPSQDDMLTNNSSRWRSETRGRKTETSVCDTEFEMDCRNREDQQCI